MAEVQRERVDVARNRRLIVDAAVRVLARDPTASVEDVGAEAGLRRSTLYRYFPARDELVNAAYAHAVDQLATRLREANLQDGGAADALRRAMRLSVGSIAGSYGLLVSGAHPSLDDDFWRRVDSALDPLALLVARAQGEGVVRATLPARWVVDLLLNVAYTALLRPDRHGLGEEDLAELAVESFLTGVLDSGHRSG